MSGDDPLASLRARVAAELRKRGDIAGAELVERPATMEVRSTREPPPDYARYRRRKLWATIKARVLERDGSTCRRCGGRADVVHHRDYSDAVMRGEADDRLVSLCDGCHTCVHYDESGRWRSWEAQEAVLATPDRDRSYPRPRIDLRRKEPQLPPGWGRMNALQRAGWSAEAHRRFNAALSLKGGARGDVGLLSLALLETRTLPDRNVEDWRTPWLKRAAEILEQFDP